jgi:hypothetical protein
MLSKFDTQIQCEELISYEPTQADWEEYHAWLEEQEAAEPELEPMDFDPHRDFYAEMDSDEYDDEDFDDIDDNELYNDPYNGEPFEDTYNDYDAWEAYCDYE